ncbi:MAG TPA: type II secretion system protein [Verrucomicrobiota bacterium]|nr:hypothetical protein [Verrucomicrobiales bacterium]HRI16800.1 type II secretion system protein [Verrucomicrobiota bacterium]
MKHIASPTRAFTLIELLLTSALIVVLTGLLLPGLKRAQAKAHAVACLSNLRQWGTATLLWSADHNGLLPPDGSPNGRSIEEGWYVDLPRLMEIPAYHQEPWRTNSRIALGRSVWICPANARRSNSNNLFHYCLNGHINGEGTGNQAPLHLVPEPSRAVWLFDNGKLAAVAGPNNVHTNLHQRGAQFVFLDGHAAHHLNSDYWNFSSNQGRTDHPELVWSPWE